MGIRISWKRIMSIITILGLLTMVVLILLGYKQGIFKSQEAFEAFIVECGAFGGLIFVLFQVVQVVIPILPGSIGCVVGVLAFGPVAGFAFNYVGICIGSILAFALAKRYGKELVRKITSDKQYEKYSSWLNKGCRFDRFFTIAVALPVAPDDFLCFLAGLTKMSFRKFILIILLGKTLTLAAYSLALSYGAEEIMKLL